MPTPETTAAVLDLLETERARLLACVGGVPEVLEHLAQVEGFITTLLATRGREHLAEPAAATLLEEARLTPERAARIRDRGERLKAPARIQPAGKLDPAEAIQGISAARASLVAAFLSADPGALDSVTQRHPAVGWLTLRGWVMFVAHHEARHAAQVVEIAAALAAAA